MIWKCDGLEEEFKEKHKLEETYIEVERDSGRGTVFIGVDTEGYGCCVGIRVSKKMALEIAAEIEKAAKDERMGIEEYMEKINRMDNMELTVEEWDQVRDYGLLLADPSLEWDLEKENVVPGDWGHPSGKENKGEDFFCSSERKKALPFAMKLKKPPKEGEDYPEIDCSCHDPGYEENCSGDGSRPPMGDW